MTENATGLKDNVAGVLCYVLGWVSGIVFLILEPNNKFIKFHAYQSIVVFGAITIASLILSWIPVIGFAFRVIIGVIAFILWLALMVLASQEKKHKLLWAGELAERWTG
jgi:uncharacterized membrane protein